MKTKYKCIFIGDVLISLNLFVVANVGLTNWICIRGNYKVFEMAIIFLMKQTGKKSLQLKG